MSDGARDTKAPLPNPNSAVYTIIGALDLACSAVNRSDLAASMWQMSIGKLLTGSHRANVMMPSKILAVRSNLEAHEVHYP